VSPARRLSYLPRKVAGGAAAAGLYLLAARAESGIGPRHLRNCFQPIPTLRWGCQLLGRYVYKDDIDAHTPVYVTSVVVPQGPDLGVKGVDEGKLASIDRDRS